MVLRFTNLVRSFHSVTDGITENFLRTEIYINVRCFHRRKDKMTLRKFILRGSLS